MKMQSFMKVFLMSLIPVLWTACDISLMEFDEKGTIHEISIGNEMDCSILNISTGDFIGDDGGVLEVTPLDEIEVTITPVFVPKDPEFDVHSFKASITAFDFVEELDYAPCTFTFAVPKIKAGEYPVTCRLNYHNESSDGSVKYDVSYNLCTVFMNVK